MMFSFQHPLGGGPKLQNRPTATKPPNSQGQTLPEPSFWTDYFKGVSSMTGRIVRKNARTDHKHAMNKTDPVPESGQTFEMPLRFGIRVGKLEEIFRTPTGTNPRKGAKFGSCNR